MNIFASYADHVRAAVRALADQGHLPAGLDLDRVVVEPPRDPSHGDLATNAAMVLAKDAKAKPRDLAEKLADELRKAPQVAKVDVAGPGFINLTLSPAIWPEVLSAVIGDGMAFGAADLGRGHKVNVEYVSANPTGPMHVGHCRGAVFGDTLANLLAFVGYDVTREYYINDAGAQVDVLARSAFLRYREALGEDIGDIPEGFYPGDYLVPVGQALAQQYGTALRQMPEAEWLPLVRSAAIDAMMVQIRQDLAALNIGHDVFFSERTLTTGATDRVAAAIAALEAAGQIYEGRLPPPKGAPPEDWEDREQTLFRSTAFGDDVDRPLKKSDGTYTYFASDIAYHHDKFLRGFTDLVDIWGADHGGYVKRMQAAVAAITGGKAALDVKLCQLVRLFRNGEPVRMSKRSGDFVTLRDVVEEVGRDAVRFMMIYRKNDAVLDFDLAKVIEQSRDNPVFYVQYAHARCHSVFRNTAAVLPSFDVSLAGAAGADLTKLTDPGEVDIIKQIAIWPRIVEQAAIHHEPHRVAFYLYDLASAFHAQWNRGKDSPHLRFIIEKDLLMTSARMALVHGVATVLGAGLGILGVEPVLEMR
ncbi:arginine--tRNA ligase [Blastochloris viridis]|uniref:Arginine--tRNA ligase n=1 Tax=Blastochloris viridis TaxID=1079 RepID=A0A0H5BQE2_BLAVI|nr:arginine--tRNA ligase [Blastochloris viridis]ALK09328.1 Arginine--tRNA ligase [Blastochloris viridis]BAS00794.1 arginyl-tRNA synthetase [Blastochloris viridis]CUU41991.1 Arginine--tRNA ligase [Blastochloris viridis]